MDDPEDVSVSDPVSLPETATISCAWCGEPAEIFIDLSAARHQRYVEDCWVCCRPNIIVVDISLDGVSTTTHQE